MASQPIDHPYAADWAKLVPQVWPASWQDVAAPDREWLLENWIPAKQATYLTGPGSAGKSLLAQQLCTCVALGRPFMGIPVAQQPAMYVTCEDDEAELHRRQKAICDALGVELRDADNLSLVSLVGKLSNELATFDRAAPSSDEFGAVAPIMRPTKLYRALEGVASNCEVGFVALDNVAHLFAGNENIRNEVAAFISLMNRLAITIGGSVLFLGHPNKAGDAFSGSTAWENQVRSRLFLETPKDGDGDILDPDARILSRGKSNYARNGETLSFRWHRWAFVRDEEIPSDYRAELAANIQANVENERFLKCLAKATEEKRATSPNRTASNYAPRLFASMTSGKGVGERGFAAAMERLLHLGTIANGQRVYQRDNRAWVTGLGLAPTSAPTPAPSLHEGCTNPFGEAQESCTDLHALTPLYTTYIDGAATEAAAPLSDQDAGEQKLQPRRAMAGGGR